MLNKLYIKYIIVGPIARTVNTLAPEFEPHVFRRVVQIQGLDVYYYKYIITESVTSLLNSGVNLIVK